MTQSDNNKIKIIQNNYRKVTYNMFTEKKIKKIFIFILNLRKLNEIWNFLLFHINFRNNSMD